MEKTNYPFTCTVVKSWLEVEPPDISECFLRNVFYGPVFALLVTLFSFKTFPQFSLAKSNAQITNSKGILTRRLWR